MGAETVEMILPFRIDGISRLFSTNGQLKKCENDSEVYLWDATVILKVDFNEKTVGHFLPSKHKYISDFVVAMDTVDLELYGTFSRVKKLVLPIPDFKFTNGFGPVINGCFPSAYVPHIDTIIENATYRDRE